LSRCREREGRLDQSIIDERKASHSMSSTAVESKEVSWKILEDVPVYGTVTRPAGAVEAPPAVILLAGSGPTDRDWCSPLLPGTNGSGRLMAELLAAKGFITLRYDKLGSGPHARENLPKFTGKVGMQTFVDELAGAVETVLSEPNVDGNSLFAVTNSEGAIHAVNYQLQPKGSRFKGMVLTGAPGRTVGGLGRSQLVAQGKSMPDAEVIMKRYDEAIAEFLAGRPMALDESLPEGLKVLLHALENPNNLPFSRELWAYSLPDYIGGVDAPMLVLIGKKDVQVDWRVDGEALMNATAGKASVSFAFPDYANHVLKHEDLPLENLTAQYVGEHYNAPGTKLDEEAADSICGWLAAQARRA
jgi:hypothetical protein